jgi:transcriptional regulator with XRE-family HTH domain
MTKSDSANDTRCFNKKQYYEYVSFGERLKKWRKAKGYTQKEAATALGVNVSYISNLERDFSATAKGGKPRPSLKFVERVSRVFGVPQSEVRVAAGYAPLEVEEMREEDALLMSLFFKHNKLTPQKKAEFRRVLEMVDRELDRIEQEEEREKTLANSNGAK